MKAIAILFFGLGVCLLSTCTTPARIDPDNVRKVNVATEKQEAMSPKDGEKITTAIKKPRLISAFGPDYPNAALAEGTGAIVRVAMAINEKGDVEAAKIVESSDQRFNAPTLRAAKKYKFSPALNSEGTPVKYSLVLPLQFSAKDVPKGKER